jgi:hypothetical protein
MTLTVLTSSSVAYWPLSAITVGGKAEYAARHGYDFRFTALPPDIAFVRMEQLLGIATDWTWASGSDVMITNHTIRLESFIDDDFDMVIGRDLGGINDDSILLRRSGLPLIEDAIQHMRECGCDSQIAIGAVMAKYRVKIVSQKLFNSYPYADIGMTATQYGAGITSGEWGKGDFAMHIPGEPMQRRINVFTKHLSDIVR